MQLYYSRKCPKSKEIITQILQNDLKNQFTFISIDRHIERKKRMPRGVRITPTLHHETETQIHVYEGDDIKDLLQKMLSSPPNAATMDLITEQPVQLEVSGTLPARDKNKYKQEPKKNITEDESWKNSTAGNATSFEIKDSGPSPKMDIKALEAQRAAQDKMIADSLEAQKNDPRIQNFVKSIEDTKS